MKTDAYANFALISQLGINMIVPIFVLLAIGIYLENKFDIFTTVPLLIVGVIVGCKNSYDLAKRAVFKSDRQKEILEDQRIVDEAVHGLENRRHD